MKTDRFKPQKLPRGLTTKEKMKRGLSYLGKKESIEARKIINEDAKEKAERSMHGGRFLAKRSIFTPSQKYMDGWDRIWRKKY